MKLAYTGSFDPWTKGHQSIVETLLDRDNSIIMHIIIGVNSKKKYVFSALARKEFIEIDLLKYKDRVKVVIVDDAVANYIYGQDIPFIVKGIRNNATDANDEITQARINNKLIGEPITLIVPQTKPDLDIVSSSNLKILNQFGLPLTDYASAFVREELRLKLTKKILVGVTGGMASGKSTLCKQLNVFSNIHHINMDGLAHIIYESELPVHKRIQKQIIQQFGLTGGKLIDRQELGDIVFKDKYKLIELTNMLLEPILHLMHKRINELPEGIILIESAILIEYNLTELVDHNVIHVECDPMEQLNRLKKRGLTLRQRKNRVLSQLSPKETKQRIKAIQSNEHNRLFMSVNTTDTKRVNNVFKIDEAVTKRWIR